MQQKPDQSPDEAAGAVMEGGGPVAAGSVVGPDLRGVDLRCVEAIAVVLVKWIVAVVAPQWGLQVCREAGKHPRQQRSTSRVLRSRELESPPPCPSKDIGSQAADQERQRRPLIS